MKTRIISGICMVPLLALVYLGGWPLLLSVLLLSLIGIREFYGGFKAMGARPAYRLGIIMTGILYITHILWPKLPELMFVWAALCVMMSMMYGFNVEKRKILDMTSTLAGLMYIGPLFMFVSLIDESELSILKYSVIIIAFGTDIFAYFTGSAFGKHKLCPKLSPKKSIEGAAGGVIGAVILNGAFMYVFMPELLLPGILLSLAGSAVSQLGDLSASAFKRQMGIKDYGKLIPGHGGVLDRFDSVLFTAPVVYVFIIVMQQLG